MTDTQTKLCLAAVALSILLVGHLNWRDIEACKDLGHSEEYCFSVYNP